MEGNRDEAEKCIGIAREALEAGNRDRALRFLGKAQKLYPTETARGEARPPSLLSAARLRRDEPRRPAGPAGGRARGEPTPGAPRRPRRAGPGPGGSPGAVAGRAARLGEEAAACAQSSAQGRCLPPPVHDSSAAEWVCLLRCQRGSPRAESAPRLHSPASLQPSVKVQPYMRGLALINVRTSQAPGRHRLGWLFSVIVNHPSLTACYESCNFGVDRVFFSNILMVWVFLAWFCFGCTAAT